MAAQSQAFDGSGVLEDLGVPCPVDRFGIEGKAKYVYQMQNLAGMMDSLVVCKFALLGGLTVDPIVEILNGVTGWQFDSTAFFLTGERIFNIKRLFNTRLGISRKDDRLPDRFLTHRRGGGTNELPVLNVMLSDYYKYRGWNEFGIPVEEKLEELNLLRYIRG